MENETLRFSPKQRQVLTWWQTGRWQALICDGAVRSGKTFCMGLSFFLWAQHDFNGRGCHFSCGRRAAFTGGSWPCAAKRREPCGGIC